MTASDQRIELVCDRLRVVFVRNGDRWAHQVELVSDQSVVVIGLRSCEGQNDDDWPPSPPIQELQLQEQLGGQLVVGLGMAGRNHWSLACSVAVGSLGSAELAFDLACRVVTEQARLGSAYRVLAGVETISLAAPVASQSIAWQHGQTRWYLAAASGERLATCADGVELAPDTTHLPIPPSTVRWGYRLGCLPNPGEDHGARISSAS